MSVLLYGITPAEAAPDEGVAGLDDRPLRTVRQDGLSAIVSDIEAPPPADHRTLWAYEHLMERLMERAPLLPARFGTRAEADEEIQTTLAERHEELLRTLERVAGAVEIAVHPPRSARNQPTSGSDYLRAKLLGRRLLEQLDHIAAGLFRERAAGRVGASAYLVERQHVERFTAEATALGATVTGPWPPYSFVT